MTVINDFVCFFSEYFFSRFVHTHERTDIAASRGRLFGVIANGRRTGESAKNTRSPESSGTATAWGRNRTRQWRASWVRGRRQYGRTGVAILSGRRCSAEWRTRSCSNCIVGRWIQWAVWPSHEWTSCSCRLQSSDCQIVVDSAANKRIGNKGNGSNHSKL